VPPGWNVKDERAWQYQKQDLEMTSTDEGMQIDLSDEQFPNAVSSR
jgi:hypothetical protein